MALTEKDRLEILELVARYSRGTDLRDPEIAEMFAENGVLEANGKVLGDSRAAIRAFLEAGRSAAQKRRHFLSNVAVDGDGQTASLQAYVAVYDVTDGLAKAPYLIGEYTDDLVKLPEGWRFLRRSLATAGGAPAPSK